jgi:hypothetical protein
MAETQQAANLHLAQGIEQIAPAQGPKDECAEVVLDVYTSARPPDAFEAAVRAYRERNPNVPTETARRAVATIICGKA